MPSWYLRLVVRHWRGPSSTRVHNSTRRPGCQEPELPTPPANIAQAPREKEVDKEGDNKNEKQTE